MTETIRYRVTAKAFHGGTLVQPGDHVFDKPGLATPGSPFVEAPLSDAERAALPPPSPTVDAERSLVKDLADKNEQLAAAEEAVATLQSRLDAIRSERDDALSRVADLEKHLASKTNVQPVRK